MAHKPFLLAQVTAFTTEVDWEAVYQANLPGIYNFFRYRIGDDRLAEDLTAETFEKAWRNRRRYRGDLAAFSTWLFTIARNVATDYFRKPRHEIPLDGNVRSGNEENLDSLIQQHSDCERLSRLLLGLPDRERELVALKYGAGLTNRAIASLSGISETNVGTILYRITRELRLAWEADHG